MYGSDSGKSAKAKTLPKTSKKKVFFIRLSETVGAVLPWLYMLFVRSWHLQWGAIREERLETLPGDELIAESNYAVTTLEKNRAMVLHSCRNPITGKPVDSKSAKPGPYVDFSWAFVLRSLDSETSRLIIRMRRDYQPRWFTSIFAYPVFEPADSIMQIGILKGIKQRAENMQVLENAN